MNEYIEMLEAADKVGTFEGYKKRIGDKVILRLSREIWVITASSPLGYKIKIDGCVYDRYVNDNELIVFPSEKDFFPGGRLEVKQLCGMDTPYFTGSNWCIHYYDDHPEEQCQHKIYHLYHLCAFMMAYMRQQGYVWHKDKCEDCSGSGYNAACPEYDVNIDDVPKCPTCNGTGEIKVWRKA